MQITDDHAIDAGIKDVVLMLNDNGFNTFESCQGGKDSLMMHSRLGD